MRLLDQLFRRLVRHGELQVIWPNGRSSIYGSATPDGRPCSMRIHDRATMLRILLAPSLAAGEAYVNGRITIEEGDILDLLDLLRFNTRWDRSNPNYRYLSPRRGWSGVLRQWNGRIASRQNVAHHYDLSDRLYRLFLDDDRQYSCAYFVDAANDLNTAQDDKKAHIAAKLHLKPGQRVLDIGCGWGGLALYLNRVADVEVLGITLSSEQLAVARRRAQMAGVADRVRFEMLDYRDVDGHFDRIVSVGMLEHVGRPNYQAFFAKVSELLPNDGVALIHTIGRADGPGETDPWTRKYIFPGGYAPALSELTPAVERNFLWMTDIEVLRMHYAYTLEHWYKRTLASEKAIVALYDDRFFRMWTFYLAGAITAFRHGGHCNFQMQLAHQPTAVPLTRLYMDRDERRLRERTDGDFAIAAE